MKLKISLDKNTIQEFFVNHLEKILFGMIVACFLLFVVSAVGRDVYDKTPEQLEQAVKQADEHLAATNPEADREPFDYPRSADRSRIRIEERFYAHETPWDWEEFEPRVKREMPMLFTVRKLRGVAGAGPFALSNTASMARERPKKKAPRKKDDKKKGKKDKDEKEDERLRLTEMQGPSTKGERWIVLTGLVPITEQEEAFDETFKDAQYRNPETDTPNYIYYRVERAEVDSRGEAAELNWVRFNLRVELAKYEDRTGPNRQPDTCDQRCLHPAICWPLPPLTGRKWGDEVVLPPEILLHPKRLQGMPEEPERTDPADPNEDPGDDPTVDMPGRARGRRAGPMGMGEMAPGGRTRGRRGVMPGGEGMMYAEGGRMGGMGPGGTKVEENPYLLFRFFDFNVKPGKRYRYRVRLLLRNPNYEVDPRWLKDKKLAAKQWVETEWSDPTGVVSVPYDDRLLATGVKAAVGAVEPFAKVMLVHRDEETGQEIVDDVDRVVRGKLMNYADREGAEHPTEREVKADFMTGSVLLDVRGGEKLPVKDSSMTRPGRMLVLDIEGNLRMRDELGDLTDALGYKKPERTRPTGMEGMRGMPGEMPPGMMMPDMGEGNLGDLGGGEGGSPRRKKPRKPRRSGND